MVKPNVKQIKVLIDYVLSSILFFCVLDFLVSLFRGYRDIRIGGFSTFIFVIFLAWSWPKKKWLRVCLAFVLSYLWFSLWDELTFKGNPVVYLLLIVLLGFYLRGRFMHFFLKESLSQKEIKEGDQ
ncbi:hypothetical protein ACVRY7_00115 [Streptococcus ictaluri]|uniref:Uncharacterized protein n=1 Tax=Streptococcus ictaluri 707-05 TaxID=764299 RepID=G5JZS3_9STRE|nr:hypothetical protein [Streptococcus ictaluri]EHI70949.1 hypothetical protein STRIC_0787 [Streptococcus ictaluri 707-05]